MTLEDHFEALVEEEANNVRYIFANRCSLRKLHFFRHAAVCFGKSYHPACCVVVPCNTTVLADIMMCSLHPKSALCLPCFIKPQKPQSAHLVFQRWFYQLGRHGSK